MSELLKCPFCGGEAYVDEHRFWSDKTKGFTEKTYGVRCDKCNASSFQFNHSKEEAIKTWNTRKTMERILERLEEESDFFSGKPMGTLQKTYYCKGIERAIEIIKEEGGIC